MIKRIHVNQHNIRRNAKEGTDLPCITVKTYKSNSYGHEVTINGPSKVVYRPDNPLSCGAKVWIETHAEVEVTVRTGCSSTSVSTTEGGLSDDSTSDNRNGSCTDGCRQAGTASQMADHHTACTSTQVAEL